MPKCSTAVPDLGFPKVFRGRLASLSCQRRKLLNERPSWPLQFALECDLSRADSAPLESSFILARITEEADKFRKIGPVKTSRNVA